MSTISLRNFSGGELSPELYKRVGLVKYQTGLKTLRNGYVARSGGTQNRPGTKFIAESITANSRMIRFLYQEQEIVLLFETTYMRWLINGRLALNEAASFYFDSITKASPGVFTTPAPHGLLNGDYVRIQVTGMTQLNNRDFIVANKTSTTFQLTDFQGVAVDTSGYDTYGFGYVYPQRRLAHGLSNLKYLKYGQPHAYGAMTLVHPQYTPKELSFDGTTFSIASITFAPTIVAPALSGLSGSGRVRGDKP